MIYAQLNEDNICISVSQLSKEVDSKNMIKLNEYDLSVLDKKYVNGLWEEVESSNEINMKTEPSNSDVLQTVNNLIADLTIAGVI